MGEHAPAPERCPGCGERGPFDRLMSHRAGTSGALLVRFECRVCYSTFEVEAKRTGPTRIERDMP